ncbi:hypothetical protein OsI_17718 [Oryza sativa Indica Group]|uniref:Uncharacterized protein n=1 Tax=Oryza sativa subsp. indica TaxID=39946 RepID=B8AVL3_ORYSI|nr:hypothetical protein OsI_17718 [Oryza sativa Indica Group]
MARAAPVDGSGPAMEEVAGVEAVEVAVAAAAGVEAVEVAVAAAEVAVNKGTEHGGEGVLWKRYFLWNFMPSYLHTSLILLCSVFHLHQSWNKNNKHIGRFAYVSLYVNILLHVYVLY